jgi:hypothetical protein
MYYFWVKGGKVDKLMCANSAKVMEYDEKMGLRPFGVTYFRSGVFQAWSMYLEHDGVEVDEEELQKRIPTKKVKRPRSHFGVG